MVKRSLSTEDGGNVEKKSKLTVTDAGRASKVDQYTPLQQLKDTLKKVAAETKFSFEGSKSVIYWMRNKDLRIEDNRALSLASSEAVRLGVPLIALNIFSVEDYKRHDRSARRVDFMIRNLKVLQKQYSDLNIPLYTETVDQRSGIPDLVISLAERWHAKQVWANIEYEVDELRRDAECVQKGAQMGVKFDFVADYLLVPPGEILTKSSGKTPLVFSPFLKQWASYIDSHKELLELQPLPKANDPKTKTDLSELFECEIPAQIKGFELPEDDQKRMKELWPEGYQSASEVLTRFIQTKARLDQIDKDPLRDGAEENESQSRLNLYDRDRSSVDSDSSSRMSPYLASGVISVREVLEKARRGGKMDTSRETGLGIWTQEIAWRDFYGHILAAFPRVCMGRPFQEKFQNVKWEKDEKMLQAWKDGKTGYPLVDAAMRQCNTQGWMHNRARMVAGMFLVKDLMQDWRLGEQYFMSQFIDGDFAANNGGWQWLASTGTDAQPYFRLMNPITQSEKSDLTGNYIHTYVPELRKLKGPALHNPFGKLSSSEFAKLNYPQPLIDHKIARDRALYRYKNPGKIEGEDEDDSENSNKKEGHIENAVRNKPAGQSNAKVKGTVKDSVKQSSIKDMLHKVK